MDAVGYVACLVLLIAWLFYQELSWRSRLNTIDHYEKRLQAEVDLAYKRGLAESKAKVRSHTYKSYKKVGAFIKRTQQLYLSVTFVGSELKYLAGDVSDIEKFEIPPGIKKAIDAARLLT
jgi:hypothetical protein